MNIDKLFNYLYTNKKLLIYLFEHRDRVVTISEIEDLASFELLENLAFYEIVELVDDKIFLDLKVVNFLEEYIDSNEIVDVAIIGSILKELEHLILNANEFKTKQSRFIPKIRRALFKINNILYKNLDTLRVHISRAYKSADEYKLKLKELKYYKDRLSEFEEALKSFEKFLDKFSKLLYEFYNEDLNIVLNMVKKDKIELFRTIIPLTQEVISYINKLEITTVFIDKIIKLKELKDSYELKSKTNIELISSEFNLLEIPFRVGSKLDNEILQSEDFIKLLKKQQNKKLKTKIAKNITINENKIIQEKIFVNIYMLHRSFKATNQNLIDFLLNFKETKEKNIDEISQIYCKMILMYEDEYKIYDEKIVIDNISFAKVMV